MTSINVYDEDAKAIEKIADDNGLMVHEVFELLMEYAKEMKDNEGLS